MLKEWHFTVLFFVGVGGAIVLLVGSLLGLEISDNPMAYSGVGSILAFVLTQRKTSNHKKDQEEKGADDQ